MVSTVSVAATMVAWCVRIIDRLTKSHGLHKFVEVIRYSHVLNIPLIECVGFFSLKERRRLSAKKICYNISFYGEEALVIYPSLVIQSNPNSMLQGGINKIVALFMDAISYSEAILEWHNPKRLFVQTVSLG